MAWVLLFHTIQKARSLRSHRHCNPPPQAPTVGFCPSWHWTCRLWAFSTVPGSRVCQLLAPHGSALVAPAAEDSVCLWLWHLRAVHHCRYQWGRDIKDEHRKILYRAHIQQEAVPTFNIFEKGPMCCWLSPFGGFVYRWCQRNLKWEDCWISIYYVVVRYRPKGEGACMPATIRG